MFFQGKTSSIHTPGPQKLVYMGSDISQIQLYPGFEELVFCEFQKSQNSTGIWVYNARSEEFESLRNLMSFSYIFGSSSTPFCSVGPPLFVDSKFSDKSRLRSFLLLQIRNCEDSASRGELNAYHSNGESADVCFYSMVSKSISEWPHDADVVSSIFGNNDELTCRGYWRRLREKNVWSESRRKSCIGCRRDGSFEDGVASLQTQTPSKKLCFSRLGGLFQWFFQSRAVSFPVGLSTEVCQSQIPSPKLTWHLKITPWKRRFLLETTIFIGAILVLGSVNPLCPFKVVKKPWPFERLDWWPTQLSRISQIGSRIESPGVQYLEPQWPLFLKVNPPKQGRSSNQNRGPHLGSRYIYLLLIILYYITWDSKHTFPVTVKTSQPFGSIRKNVKVKKVDVLLVGGACEDMKWDPIFWGRIKKWC